MSKTTGDIPPKRPRHQAELVARRRTHVDLLATGPLGGAETAEEAAAADAALDALGARRRAEMAAGGDPYRADLLPDPDGDPVRGDTG